MNERPLKFRIYSYVDKLWHYFDIYEGYPQGIYGAVTPPQQFTGLTDKNGKDIYEGDILKMQNLDDDDDEETKCGFVEFSSDYGAFTASGFALMQCFMSNNEIIGNVIENKELLQK